jgi:hypothetical protein
MNVKLIGVPQKYPKYSIIILGFMSSGLLTEKNNHGNMNLFQNPVGFEASSWKNRQKSVFSSIM